MASVPPSPRSKYTFSHQSRTQSANAVLSVVEKLESVTKISTGVIARVGKNSGEVIVRAAILDRSIKMQIVGGGCKQEVFFYGEHLQKQLDDIREALCKSKKPKFKVLIEKV